ncbi:MAG TPA: transposase [Oscillospiraceae bacterium]|nr:transposase [Clostridiales bacterium]HZK21403.1 transposase [Oscillospiraceae bacterium]
MRSWITALFRVYSSIGRRPAANPITLFKILVYGGMDGRHSSRELESACRRDINYIWLLGDEKIPNYSKIARLCSKRLSECCEDLFYQLVKRLYERVKTS